MVALACDLDLFRAGFFADLTTVFLSGLRFATARDVGAFVLLTAAMVLSFYYKQANSFLHHIDQGSRGLFTIAHSLRFSPAIGV